MTLVELLKLANSAYPDGYLAVYYDSRGRKRAGSGDTLAQFIVTELIETFAPKASEEDQIENAIAQLELARTDIDDVIAAIKNRRQTRTIENSKKRGEL